MTIDPLNALEKENANNIEMSLFTKEQMEQLQRFMIQTQKQPFQNGVLVGIQCHKKNFIKVRWLQDNPKHEEL